MPGIRRIVAVVVIIVCSVGVFPTIPGPAMAADSQDFAEFGQTFQDLGPTLEEATIKAQENSEEFYLGMLIQSREKLLMWTESAFMLTHSVEQGTEAEAALRMEAAMPLLAAIHQELANETLLISEIINAGDPLSPAMAGLVSRYLETLSAFSLALDEYLGLLRTY